MCVGESSKLLFYEVELCGLLAGNNLRDCVWSESGDETRKIYAVQGGFRLIPFVPDIQPSTEVRPFS